MNEWWVRVSLAVVFLALSYGFISLAIDSGHLWQYAIGIGFLVWAARYLVRGVRFALSR